MIWYLDKVLIRTEVHCLEQHKHIGLQWSTEDTFAECRGAKRPVHSLE